MLLSRVVRPLLRPPRDAKFARTATLTVWTGGPGSNHSNQEIESTAYLMGVHEPEPKAGHEPDPEPDLETRHEPEVTTTKRDTLRTRIDRIKEYLELDEQTAPGVVRAANYELHIEGEGTLCAQVERLEAELGIHTVDSE